MPRAPKSDLQKRVEKNGFRFKVRPFGVDVAVKYGKGEPVHVGHINLREDVEGALRVGSLNISPAHHRGGVGTVLYELAAQLACKQGARFVSDHSRSEFAEAFWRKQESKGRAECFEDGEGSYYAEAMEEIRANLEHQCEGDWDCVEQGLRAYRRLPRPSSQGTWPCRRWALKQELCAKISLAGLPRKGRKL